ncbi:MAG: YicC family protein, partial [Desulfobacterales bacterium]|nr:YicC family protein [Desulfobacterales bacterium]
MIKSMTAFATAENTADELTVKIEIRSYNSRHLDIVLRIPPACQPLEDKIKGLISSRVARGRLEIRAQVDDGSDEALALEVDFSRAKALVTAFKELKGQFDFKNDITLEMLLGAGGVIK